MRWKYKCFWLDFYIDGLKPVCQLGLDHRFGYRAQPLSLCVRWFFAKGQRENGQGRAGNTFPILASVIRGGSLGMVRVSGLKATNGVVKVGLFILKPTGGAGIIAGGTQCGFAGVRQSRAAPPRMRWRTLKSTRLEKGQ